MLRSNPTGHQVAHSEDIENLGWLHSLAWSFLCHQLRKRQQNPMLKANHIFLSQFNSQLVNYMCLLPAKISEAVSCILDFSAVPDVTDMLNWFHTLGFFKIMSWLKKKNTLKCLGFTDIAPLASACRTVAWKLEGAIIVNDRTCRDRLTPWVPKWNRKASPMKQSHRYGRNRYSTHPQPATHRTCPEHSLKHKMRSRLH